MTNSGAYMRGILSFVALLALIVGVPIALVAMTGSPFPDTIPSSADISHALTRPISDSAVVRILSFIGWTAWLQLTWSITSEVASVTGKRTANTVRAVGGVRQMIRPLVLSAMLLFSSAGRTTPSVVSIPAAIHAVAISPAPHGEMAASPAAPVQPTCTVKARDDLWLLAERHLNDPMRWREIFEMNKGRSQPDGRSLSAPDLINPGWVLVMPADATGLTDAIVPNQPTTPSSTDGDAAQELPVSPPEVSAEGSNDDADESATHDTWHLHNERLGTIGGGLGAAGVVVMLNRLRRRWQRRREFGDRFNEPSTDDGLTEVLLRKSADLPAAKRLDGALRSLSACLSQRDETTIPNIDAVRVTPSTVEILFNEPIDAPHGPFDVSGGGRTWSVDSTVAGIRLDALSNDVVATVPALTSVGTTDNAAVLIDLESHPITAIVGDDLACRALHESMALELTTQVWADFVDVVIAGPMGLHANLERVRRANNIDDAISMLLATQRWQADGLKANGHRTTLEARTVDGTSEGWVPTVLFCTADQAHSVPRLEAGQGVAVVILGEYANADRVIEVHHDGVFVSPPDINLDCISFSLNDVRAIDHLLVEASTPATTPPVPDVISLNPDSEQPSAFAEAPVRVCVLGPVEIEGSARPIERTRPAELIAYLTLHRGGVSAERLKTMLWPDRVPTQSTFNSTVSYARNKLDKTDDRERYIPVVTDGSNYRISEAVRSDADEFRRLVRIADFAAPDDARNALREALALVRGAPFAEHVDGYEWAHAEGLVTELTALIGDAAHRLADLALAANDFDECRWAARQGLLASAGYELLYRDLMTAYASQGNRSGVESIMKELRTVLDVDEFDDSLQAETVALYKTIASGKFNKVRM